MGYINIFDLLDIKLLYLRMSNYNDGNKNRYNDALYSYNSSNWYGKISQVEYDEIQIIGTKLPFYKNWYISNI